MTLPADFVRLMQMHWPEKSDKLCHALLHTEPNVSVRLNPAKWPAHSTTDSLALSDGLVEEAVPWCTDAFYLAQRPAFTYDPLLHAGAYYVQEAGSMFLAQAIKQHVPNEPLVALDLCAAPGGKSTLLRSLLHPDSLLVSNEPMRQRAQVLAENMIKWGDPGCVVTQNYPQDFAHLTHTFDLIVADVPCSGEGMFRKDDKAINDWSMQNVDLCWRRQRDIISDIWPTLKPGGWLVYSTCTFNRFEDEENIEWICHELGAERLKMAIEPEWNIVDEYHFFPGYSKGEGFFLSILRKADAPLQSFSIREEKAKKQKGKERNNVAAPQLQPLRGSAFTYFVQDEHYTAVPTRHAPLMRELRHSLRVLMEGVGVAEWKGRDWQPSHALALSTALQPDAYPTASLTYEQALSYLRREAIVIDAPRGYVIVAYQGLPLGFVKNLGNRANNLYPQEWRIRSGYTTPFSLMHNA